MKFAVTIVTYNRLELLKECIQQVLSQTVPFSYICIVDNHSTDGTSEYLDQLALELLLLCFALSVLVQVYLQGSTWNFALISTGTALVVLSLDWLFFYYMPGYSWALSRWLTFVLPSAMMTLVPSLMLFSLVRHIYSAFKIDNGVV